MFNSVFTVHFIYIGEPTLTQKAELIIRSLRLGVDADSTTRTPAPVTRPPPTQPRYVTSRGGWFSWRRYYIPPPPPVAINKYCPAASRQANNRICPNMCPRGMDSMHAPCAVVYQDYFEYV